MPPLIERYDRPYAPPLQKSTANVVCHPCMLCVQFAICSNCLSSKTDTLPNPHLVSQKTAFLYDGPASTGFAIHLGRTLKYVLPLTATFAYTAPILQRSISLLLRSLGYFADRLYHPVANPSSKAAPRFHSCMTRQLFNPANSSSWYVVS